MTDPTNLNRRTFNQLAAAAATTPLTGGVPEAAAVASQAAAAIPVLPEAMRAALQYSYEHLLYVIKGDDPLVLRYVHDGDNSEHYWRSTFVLRLRNMYFHLNEYARLIETLREHPDAVTGLISSFVQERKALDEKGQVIESALCNKVIDQWLGSAASDAAKGARLYQGGKWQRGLGLHMDAQEGLSAQNAYRLVCKKLEVVRSRATPAEGDIHFLYCLASRTAGHGTPAERERAGKWMEEESAVDKKIGDDICALAKKCGVDEEYLRAWAEDMDGRRGFVQKIMDLNLSLDKSSGEILATFDRFVANIPAIIEEWCSTQPLNLGQWRVLEAFPHFIRHELPGLVEEIKHEYAMEKLEEPERSHANRLEQQRRAESAWARLGGRGNDIY